MSSPLSVIPDARDSGRAGIHFAENPCRQEMECGFQLAAALRRE
jgi:hypothetical protein